MTPNQIEAYKALEKAQMALKYHEKRLAHRFAEQAAHLAPELEEVWLMLGALSTPQGSVLFLQKALDINPQSERAQKGLAWAQERLRKEAETPRKQPSVEKTAPSAAKIPVAEAHPAATQPISIRRQTEKAAITTPVKAIPVQAVPAAANRPKRPAGICVIPCWWPLWRYFALSPSCSSRRELPRLRLSFFAGGKSGPAWAQVNLPKPTYTVTGVPTEAATLAFSAATDLPAVPTLLPTFTDIPTETPVPTFTLIPTSTSAPTETATNAPVVQATTTPQLAEDASPTPLPTDTALPGPTQYVLTPPSDIANGTRWIDVDLTNQMVYAYEGQTLVNSFVTSTGTWQYPTVTGQYRVYIKFRYKDMSGPGYYLPDVPFTMFFYQGYAIHGTYWHNNFGTPMSHGCVNLSIPDSEWIYNFSSVGTLVNVHY